MKLEEAVSRRSWWLGVPVGVIAGRNTVHLVEPDVPMTLCGVVDPIESEPAECFSDLICVRCDLSGRRRHDREARDATRARQYREML